MGKTGVQTSVMGRFEGQRIYSYFQNYDLATPVMRNVVIFIPADTREKNIPIP